MTRIRGLSIVALPVLILGITGCGAEQSRPDAGSANSGPARILSISYEYGSSLDGYRDFDLRTGDGQVLFSAHGSGGVDLEINSRPVPDDVLVELQNIIDDYDIARWDGFSTQDTEILDGYSFALSVNYENSTELNASGYMLEPDNYKQGHAALSEYFLALAEAPVKYSFLDYKRMAEENLDLPLGVEVSLNNTPNGGVFSVAFFTDADGVPVSKDEAINVEIHECDENGNSINRTYMKRD